MERSRIQLVCEWRDEIEIVQQLLQPDIAIVTLFANRRFAPRQKVRQCTQCRLSKCYIYLMPCGEVIHGKKITYTAKRTVMVQVPTVYTRKIVYLLHGEIVV